MNTVESRSKKFGLYSSHVQQQATFKKRMSITRQVLHQYVQQSALAKLRILDLGCGIGDPAADLASLGHSIASVDVDSKCVDLYNARKVPNAIAYVGNIESVDMRGEGGSGKYDVVLCFEALEHVLHPDLVLRNANRHLGKGGLIILSTPNGYSLWEMGSRILRKMHVVELLYRLPLVYKLVSGMESPVHCATSPHLHIKFYSLKALKVLFESQGFHISRICNLNLGVVPPYPNFYELERVECMLADYIPLWAGGAWLFVASKL